MAIFKALERVRPGRRFTLPATAGNPQQPGDVIKIAFTGTASLEQIFRVSGTWPLPEQFISMKTTSDVHVVFGPSAARIPVATGGLQDPTDADLLLQPGDSWQDFQLSNVDEAFKLKGDGVSAGNFYLLISGR